MPNPERIIIRSPNWVGDQVMATPFYAGLRKSYPLAHITLLCAEPLVDLVPRSHFNDHLALTTEQKRNWREMARLGRKIRDGKYDLSITIPATPRAAFPFCWAGIPNRVGFQGDWNSLFLTAYIPWKGAKSGKHKTRLYLELLEWLTSEPSPSKGGGLDPASEYEDLIVVAPGASISLREWPYFDVLFSALRKDFPTTRLVAVGTAEKKWQEMFSTRRELNVEDRMGQTTLADLTELCRRARLVVANDSGAAHVSGTLSKAPTLVLFGPGNPDYIQPTGPRVYSLRVEGLRCSPCDKPYCRAPYGYQRCLTDLPVERVLALIHQILG